MADRPILVACPRCGTPMAVDRDRRAFCMDCMAAYRWAPKRAEKVG